jgi:predicted ATPase
MLREGSDVVRPLVGRNDEMVLITSMLDAVESRGGALVLRGEPGIGKSRLLQEAAPRRV